MAILNAIQRRYSVRSYQDKAVEEEKLRNVLEAARLAPSARNLQGWRFIVIRDADQRARLAEACNNQTFVGQAPIVIVGCGTNTDYVMRGGQTAYPIDMAIAIDHMTLQAVEEGLGTCWIGSFIEDKVREILSIPASARVVCLLPLGYPADQPKPKNRLPPENIIADDQWRFAE